MAVQYFGIERGAARTTVTTGTSTTSKKIELAVDDTVGITRKEVEDQVQLILDFIMDQRTTPFAQ